MGGVTASGAVFRAIAENTLRDELPTPFCFRVLLQDDGCEGASSNAAGRFDRAPRRTSTGAIADSEPGIQEKLLMHRQRRLFCDDDFPIGLSRIILPVSIFIDESH